MLDSLDTLIGFALIYSVVSLMVTVLVQVVTSLSHLRGKNLAWGVAEAIAAIDPKLAAEVNARGKNLADHLLKDPLLSDGQLGRDVSPAKAVRPAELFDLIRRIAVGGKPGTPPQIRADAIQLLQALGVPASVFNILPDERAGLVRLGDELRTGLESLPAGVARDELTGRLAEVEARLKNAGSLAEDAALRWVGQGEEAIRRCYETFAERFETGQERAQEWFATHARIITAIVGCVAAFGLQLDAFDIFKRVSSDRELRKTLIEQAAPVIARGEKILQDGPSVLAEAFGKVAKATNAPAGTRALLQKIEVARTDTPEALRRRIESAVTYQPPADLTTVLGELDQQILAVVKARLEASDQHWNALESAVATTGFAIFPEGGCRWPEEKLSLGTVFRHSVGMACSALLLSLGAPFWFNALRELTGLRSRVARNISAERKSEAGNA